MADHKLLPPLAALKAFEAVGRLGGLRPAGRELEIDHAVIGRHIRALEIWVGVPLVMRDGRSYRLTEKGEAYHQQIGEALGAIVSATGKLMRSGELKLRIWCIPGFAALWMADRLNLFMSANPDIDVDFRPADNSPDFRSKEVDCDIRYLRSWEEDALPKSVRRLEFARPVVFPVASPECLLRLPQINRAEDLLRCPLLHEENDLEWLNWFAQQGVTTERQLAGTRLWQAHLTLNAARQGQGITLTNHMLLGDDLKKGRLVVVRPKDADFKPVRFGGYALVAREDRWNIPAFARFRRWIRTEIADAQSGRDVPNHDGAEGIFKSGGIG